VFYELLSGKKAFAAKGMAQIMMAILSGEPRPLPELAPEAPAPLVGIIERSLRKDPARRYQTAGELAAALDVARAVYA
jgi:serine/threonine-protein kinase